MNPREDDDALLAVLRREVQRARSSSWVGDRKAILGQSGPVNDATTAQPQANDALDGEGEKNDD